MEYSIHWFRRDLRLEGNHLLEQMISENEGKVLGIFCFDKTFLSRDDFSVNRFQFFLMALKKLKEDMRKRGGDLLVLDAPPAEAFSLILKKIQKKKISLPKVMSWNRDYEPFARKRDDEIEKLLEEFSILSLTARDHLLIEPWELLKDDGTPYQVFTPFSRKWLEIFESDEVQKRVKKEILYLEEIEKSGKEGNKEGSKEAKKFKITWKDLLDDLDENVLDHFIKTNGQRVDIEIPEAGSLAAFNQLKAFSPKINNYAGDRDIPSIDGTSKLAMYLKNGSISSSQVILFLNLKGYLKKTYGKEVFFSELIWREFYYHILYHFPEVEHEAFNKKYNKLKWENSKSLFEKWKKGETGFPIVDAAMKQLNQTGWMHNRLRMIVGSFLTKDLLIDWKWGEQYFMEKLLDGDVAANNGGWQWVASTGVDACPYFRVFNPWLQGKKFDPDGKFIKEYLPELKDLDAKFLHSPNLMLSAQYMSPIIDHDTQRFKILKIFKEVNP